MGMKFCGWIDLIKGEGSAPFEFCPVHISKTILAMAMKFWIDLIKGECSAHEP